MKTKSRNKRSIVGYALFVKPVQANPWTRVGYLFNNREEARIYYLQRWPTAYAASIRAVRLDAQPIDMKEAARAA